jgi:hypothetical protein
MHKLTPRQELYGVDTQSRNEIVKYTVNVYEVKKTVFTVTSNDRGLYNRTYKLSNLHHKEWSGHRLFLTITEREEFIHLCNQQKMASIELGSHSYGNYTLDQINRIINILNENK